MAMALAAIERQWQGRGTGSSDASFGVSGSLQRNAILADGWQLYNSMDTGVQGMGQKAKVIQMHDGEIDLSVYSWDDERFSHAGGCGGASARRRRRR